MPIGGTGSKFAHLWQEESSQTPSSPETSSEETTEDETMKATMGFLKSFDQGPINYALRDQESLNYARKEQESMNFLGRDEELVKYLQREEEALKFMQRDEETLKFLQRDEEALKFHQRDQESLNYFGRDPEAINGHQKERDHRESLRRFMPQPGSRIGAMGTFLGTDLERADLFASFGYDTSFGTVTSTSNSPQRDPSSLTTSPSGRSPQKYNGSVAERAFEGVTASASSSASWPSSENASGGSPSFRNISDRSIGAQINCSPFVPRADNSGGDLCHSQSYSIPKESEGDLMGAIGLGCQGQLLSTPGQNGHCFETPPKYVVNSLTGLDGPRLTSSPVSTSSIETDTSGFHGGPYGSLTTTLTYIAGQLAELGGAFGNGQDDFSPRSPWGNSNRFPGFGNVNQETMQKWIRMLRNIQDTLMTTVDMDGTQRAQMLELTCTLQKQLLYHMVGEESTSKVKSHFCGVPPDYGSESHLQAAKFLREHAGKIGFYSQEPYLWKGVLPRRDYQNAVFSCKVFLGGLPYDMTEQGMIQAFKPFGNVRVEWPGKEINPIQHKGYSYIIFENEKQVNIMLQHCTVDYNQDGKWFCKMSSRRVRMKLVEVIPWTQSDSNYALRPTSKLESRLTIFVGALHGMLNAEGLAVVMEDLFSGVVHAGIDTDKNKYPIGSGRVTFDNFQSYFTAINAAFVEIKSSKFSKIVQMDPYLEDSNCSHCSLQQAPYFCRSFTCFRYYCLTCFELAHASEALRSHRRMMRSPNKKMSITGFTSPSLFKPNYRTM